MRYLLPILLLLSSGCTMLKSDHPADPAPPALREPHAKVRVDGIDGTIMYGQLLNNTITIESGQGNLTLQTDHIYDVTITPEFDTVESPSINVSGKIRETQFLLENEHGVLSLLKERLRHIAFLETGPRPKVIPPPTRSSTTTSDWHPPK